VCINGNFELGSMIPQIEWALANNFEVLVMNPNLNKDPENGDII